MHSEERCAVCQPPPIVSRHPKRLLMFALAFPGSPRGPLSKIRQAYRNWAKINTLLGGERPKRIASATPCRQLILSDCLIVTCLD
ncbi:hypothetical protein SAMN06265222_101546 [Neorhodopirellula lusitana]|uniref:Uncharacterized protein n=1 Tax=Neorhodopirellula lusitana TaxID=445327 RepID=A0ABY1PQI7_9BACT|nr:hypothetical protein SAMN06265222_101546 [Neorhodopirellula lusitana]